MLLNLVAATVCIVVFADDRPSTKEIYQHEIAHCNGWVHPKRAAPKVGQNYQAYKAPARYLHEPDMEVQAYPMSSKEAKDYCDGHWGCQWFEEE